jgi:glutathione reductase (NADPH)
MEHDCDLLVIGAGSGGVRASRIAASLGARVAVCDAGPLGGTCVNVGCVPKKLFAYAAHHRSEWHDAEGFGWSAAPPQHDLARLQDAKDAEIARLNGVYRRLLERHGVEIIEGRGALVDPHTVEISATGGAVRRVSARNIVIAVGGHPARPAFPGSEHILVSDDVFRMRALPRRLLVIGGGYIAVEMAGIFHGLGSRVTLAHRGRLFLRGFDRDVRVHLDQELRRKGLDLRFGCEVARVEPAARGPEGALRVVFEGGGELEVDAVLAAIGREPRTAGMGLTEVGVALDAHGAIEVDERFRSSLPSVYAIGDVIGRVQLTPVALAEGEIVARGLYGGADLRADYAGIPSAVFSDPPIGAVGLSEEEARAEHGAIDVYRSVFTPMKATLSGSGERSLMKLVVDRSTDRVLGVHVVGPDAGEIVQGFAVAVRCGATKRQFDSTIGIHPTAAEELVTMRERLPDPDRDLEVFHDDAPRRRPIVHRRWE